eukprot:3333833-Prymnesium_polylepis.1
MLLLERLLATLEVRLVDRIGLDVDCGTAALLVPLLSCAFADALHVISLIARRHFAKLAANPLSCSVP